MQYMQYCNTCSICTAYITNNSMHAIHEINARHAQVHGIAHLSVCVLLQIAELSNTYYMLMPMANYTFERIPPLNETHDIERHLDALYNLTELADASKILLGAQYRSKGMFENSLLPGQLSLSPMTCEF